MKIRDLLKDSIIYGVGGFINRFLGFLILPIFTNYLSPENYGVMAMLSLLSVFLTGVFSFGTGNSLGICYFETDDLRKRCQLIWTNFFLLVCITLTLFAVSSLFVEQLSQLLFNSEQYSYLVILSLLALAINVTITPLHAYLRMERKALLFVGITFFSAIFGVCLSLFLVVGLGHGLAGLVESSAITAIMILLISLAVAVKYVRFEFSFELMKPLLKIGYPSIFGLGAFFVVDYADRAMIQHFIGLAELGLYNIGYSFGLVMVLLAEGAFGSSWAPFFMSFINKRGEAKELFGRIFKYYIFLFGFIALLFFMLAKPIVALMTAETFHSAYLVVGIIATASMLKVAYLITLPGLYFEKKLHIQSAVEWFAAFINLGLNLILIPLWGMVGAALATLFSYIVLVLLGYLSSRKYLAVCYEWVKIVKFMVLFSLFAFITYFPAFESFWLSFLVEMILYVLISAYVYHALLASRERIEAKEFFLSLRNKFK